MQESHNGHRMLYTVRTFVSKGYIVYELPEVADLTWNYFDIDWMKCDFYQDEPTMNAQYKSTAWNTSNKWRIVHHDVMDSNISKSFDIEKHQGSYIHNLTINDISVFNFTTLEWEDLSNENRWKLEVREDYENNDYGFRLTLLESGSYSYDMRLYLNKIPETQMRNAELKRNAIFNISAHIYDEVSTKTLNTFINIGNNLRIRKLFHYEQKESYIIGYDEDGKQLGYEMDFKLANYIHFKNEIHLEDIKIYNKTIGRFEDLLNPKMFEVRFKDDRAKSRGYETQTTMIQSTLIDTGEGFSDGEIWGYNDEYQIQVFGYATADFLNDGHLLTFTPIHCPNPPSEDLSLEFRLFQYPEQMENEEGLAIVEFNTQRLEVWGDGYIHNVVNRLAPVPKEFKVICQYDLDSPVEYEIIVSKIPHKWTFIEDKWKIFPTFSLKDIYIPNDQIYILTDKGRFPLTNPSTGKPTLSVSYTDDGTDVLFLNLYPKY